MEYLNTQIKSSLGFSLIEVLVALSLLTVVFLGIVQLMARSGQVAEQAQDKFIAASLAREGLELVRAVRDTTWFTDADRSHWIQGAMCGDFTYDAARLRQQQPFGTSADSRLYIQSDGQWTHQPNTSGETSFQRVMSVDCSEKDNTPPRVTVSSRVGWDYRGQQREVVLKERLYNWLP